MNESTSLLRAWESFYVIVGSSGGALIGLQFVVITLIADSRRGTHAGALSAFGTPTVIHLAGALVVSAIMSAPWPSIGLLAATLGTCGVLGVAYGATVLVRARRQTGYRPVWQDWIWYVTLPCLVYAALAVAAFCLRTHTEIGLAGVAAVALALLLVGIHNAWDTVTHLVVSDG
ncbi:MAG: hypothetical protein V7647_721 [Acidobacteriota bacterium]|jgi:hypothetical protein